ncbi:hypothetical protein [Lentimicrobium sp. S6]|uniref:hypothetical protein n=1 Tax=Lentimicrobium sp. S6 TaxID=2735872 RepID=UPI0015539333|nr:hypothetical protein [Lentimicrobium sp. S6]NPD44520.1 hypothetical protein [Lentimicrobium sp. S6]
MWELLQAKGYDPDNIFVLFADGVDYSFNHPLIDDRYKPSSTVTVTDYPATLANLQMVFNGLRLGNGGFPQLTEDDFLFVWTFDHGMFIEGHARLLLMDDEYIIEDDFAALVNPIPAHKKAFWMLQCNSGGFNGALEGQNTVFHSACQYLEGAESGNDTPDIENELINGKQYTHSECFFHMYSSTNGESPAYLDSYDNEDYTDADLNTDLYISLYESWIWESDHEDLDETPLFSDLGAISAYTSLEYPTLLHSNMTTNESHRGIIGISKSFSVKAESELVLLKNSKVDILNGSELTVESGATLTIGKYVEFTNGKIIIEDGATVNIDTDLTT